MPARRSPWMVAAVAFVVMGAAYVGLYLLLTASARRERDDILRARGAEVRAAVEPRESGRESDRAEWNRAYNLWQDRKHLEARETQIRTLFGALLGAFAVQTALTLWILAKTARRAGPSG